MVDLSYSRPHAFRYRYQKKGALLLRLELLNPVQNSETVVCNVKSIYCLRVDPDTSNKNRTRRHGANVTRSRVPARGISTSLGTDYPIT